MRPFYPKLSRGRLRLSRREAHVRGITQVVPVKEADQDATVFAEGPGV
ncbi:MAG: hypothetical protein WBA18_21480 [Terracidiphilus sp.]